MRAIKIKTRNIIVLFFSLFLTLAVFSQINAANPKPTTVVGLNKADWLYYKSSNDLSAYLGKKSSNLPTVRYQKNNDYLEFSLNNVSSATSASLETDTKKPNTPTLFYRNILDGVDANYQITNLPFKVKEEIVLKETFPTSHVGKAEFLFYAETSAKPVKQDDGSIAFFGDNDEYLFQLDKPFMIDAEGERSEEVSIEIIPIQTKNTSEEMFFADSNLERKSGLSPVIDKYTGIKTFVNSLYVKYVDNKKVLDLRGIEPPRRGLTIPTLRQAAPRTGLVYHKPKPNPHNLTPANYQITLSANSDWLSTAAYPVIIDPTVTHNADANFTGQFNRIADSDTTSSTQLESSYPEATKDPYTVLLLHFNEANGTTAGIRDYASTTRVITANGNASTTSYVTQLGLGNSAAFDGTGDYLSVADSDDWNFVNGDFTVEAWVYFNSIGSTQSILSQYIGGNDFFNFQYYQPSGILRFYSISTGPTRDTALISSWSPSANKWYHLAAVRSGSSGFLFIDGVSQTVTLDGWENFANLASTLTVGYDQDSGSYLNGSLDSLRIIKGRALTPEEIRAAASRRPYAVYTSPVVDATASMSWNTVNWTEGGVNTGNGEQPYNTSSLVAQWDFNDTSGTTLTASSSGSCTTSCNGTLTNFASTASQDQAVGTGWTANNKKWGAGALMMESAAAADYVSITDPASNVLDPNSADLTIETWIKTSDTSAEIFSNNNANGTACTSNGYYLGIDASGYAVFYLDTNGATAGCDASITSQFKINDGSWHNVSVSVTRGTSAIIYIDGKSAGSDTSVTSYSAITVTGNGFFGGSAGGLDAVLDSSRFYSRALSAFEILSNYNAGNIEIQTRTGATSDPNDGSWEAWKPTTGETQMFSLDNDAVNWHSDIMASTTIATSTETVIKAEGTGSLKIRTGMASTTAGTVALWHFEETGTTTGTTLYDETANNNDATTTGTTVVDGIFGKARKFNGTSDYVSVGDSDNWNMGTGDFTLETWVKFNDLTGAQVLLSQWQDGNNVLRLFKYATHELAFVNNYGGVAKGSYITAAPIAGLAANIWYHIVFERTTTTAKLFVNGESKTLTETTAFGTSDAGNNTGTFYFGQEGDGLYYFNGSLDEPRILKGRALSADEIAETYRMGANHHLTRQVSAVDLSAQTKLAFNIAADRPGTYLEAMLGESDYANYELASSTLALSTTTVLYIKGDEIAPSTSLKDSSFSGKAITANGNARTAGGGKIGNAVYFDGTGDYLSTPDDASLDFAAADNFTIDFWIKHNTIATNPDYAITKADATTGGYKIYMDASGDMCFDIDDDATWTPDDSACTSGIDYDNDVWHHVAGIKTGTTKIELFVDGVLVASDSALAASGTLANTNGFYVGMDRDGSSNGWEGYLDEIRIIKGTALTPDQIRQAYEYGLRTHPITIDFGATLQTSDLISSATDYNFSLTATTSGLSATTSGLYLGDKMIIKENLGGTEYTAQGTVNAINTTTGAITVPSWDSGSTFPASNGYSPNATVFKWQREYFDITGAATTTRDAITNLTLRPTNGAEGRTIYLDDFRYNTNYLTASSSSAVTSGNNRYLQYRAVFSSWDTFVSPYLSAFNTLYTALANSFPALIGISGGGFLSF